MGKKSEKKTEERLSIEKTWPAEPAPVEQKTVTPEVLQEHGFPVEAAAEAQAAPAAPATTVSVEDRFQEFKTAIYKAQLKYGFGLSYGGALAIDTKALSRTKRQMLAAGAAEKVELAE